MSWTTERVWACVLWLLCCAGPVARADDPPRLPRQYAEVLLNVEGMI